MISLIIFIVSAILTMKHKESFISLIAGITMCLSFLYILIVKMNVKDIFKNLLLSFKIDDNSVSPTPATQPQKKEQKSTNRVNLIATTIFFKDGQMYNTIPKNADNWYNAQHLISDGTKYDLESIEGIQSIKVPNFKYQDIFAGYGVTGSLDYVLRMKAGNFYNRKEKELCSVCLWKATELMLENKYGGWRKEDYDRLVNWHNALGMFDEARKAEKYLQNHPNYLGNSFNNLADQIKNSTLENARRFGCDLVAFHDYGHGCCSECSKMTGRVYSISGKNKKFPKLPEYVKQHGNFHEGCRCTMTVFFDRDTEIYYKGERVNAIKASNRPYVDNRTQQEIELYNKYLNLIKNKEKEDADRKEYYSIRELLPDVAPKSFNAYRRMKGQQTDSFKRLVEIANANGISIKL